MELATIAAAAIALRYVRFAFLTAPIAFSRAKAQSKMTWFLLCAFAPLREKTLITVSV